MKKQITLFLTVFLLLSSVGAQIRNLSVRKDPTSSAPAIPYEYKGNFGNNYYWIGKELGQEYIIYNISGTWVLRVWQGDFFFGNNIDLSQSTEKYPLTGWSTIQVQFEGPRLFYSTTSINEAPSNNGEFIDTILIRHNKSNNKQLSGNVGDDLITKSSMEVDRLPSGLTAHAILVSDSTVKLFFSGNAKEHKLDSSMEIRFKNAAFANGGTADSTIGSTMPIQVNFINSWIVGNEPNDLKLIQSALDSAKNYDVVFIRKGTYTQTGILRKDQSKLMEYVYFIGEGPEATIIQGSNIPFDSTGRIFYLVGIKTAHFKNLTIQNADAKGMSESGGAIFSPAGKVVVENCRFTKNRTHSTSNYGSGGALNAQSVHVKNSEFSDNHAQTSNKGAGIHGGAIFAQVVTIENSTFSGNSCVDFGGAVVAGSQSLSTIINSTFVNNSSKNLGGAVFNYFNIKIYNSIFSNNRAMKGGDIYSVNNHVYKINATNSYIKDTGSNYPAIKMFSVNPSFDDPKIDTTLKFNCGVLQTHALLDGSPCIDNSQIDTINVSSFDQRGYSKVGKRDIGAHEFAGAIEFNLLQDSVCIEDKLIIDLNAQPHLGAFSGKYVSNNQLNLSTVTEEGYVYVNYEFNLPGCENSTITDSIFVKMCKQNSTKTLQLPVTFYPNPAQNELFIQNAMGTSMNLVIYSITGNKVADFTQLEARAQVNINHLNSGIYFATIESNGLQTTVKFIKQ